MRKRRYPFNLGTNRDYESEVPTVKGKLHDHRVILLVSLMFLVGFLLVATLRSSFVTLDLSVNAWASSINKSSFMVVAEEISIIFDTNALVIISLVLAAVFSVKNRWRYGALLLGTMGGDALIVEISKMLIMSPRPLNEVIHATDYSFPSGHVAGSVAFFGILTYFAWKNWASARTRSLTGGLYTAIILLIGFDRIYLNLHWFSDVAGGFLLGAFWLVFTLWVFHWSRAGSNPSAPLMVPNQIGYGTFFCNRSAKLDTFMGWDEPRKSCTASGSDPINFAGTTQFYVF